VDDRASPHLQEEEDEDLSKPANVGLDEVGRPLRAPVGIARSELSNERTVDPREATLTVIRWKQCNTACSSGNTNGRNESSTSSSG